MAYSGEQQEILDIPYGQNIIVSACAGSGKSTVLVERALLEEKTLDKTHKKICVLSFTNKSVEDIRKKIGNNHKKIDIRTFHSFFYQEILPFTNETCLERKGNVYNIELNFNSSINEYEEWKKYFIKEHTILQTGIKGKDFALQYSLEILNNGKSCLDYLKSKFSTIYIDEAQDNNELQYEIIEKLRQVVINFFIVGDHRQVIYNFRGASAVEFKKLLENKDYISKKLTWNFRCDKNINNFAQGYNFDESNLINEKELGVFVVKKENYSLLSKILTSDEEVVFLRSTNNLAKETAENLKDRDFVFLRTLEFDSRIEEEVLKVYFTNKNSVQLLKNLGIGNTDSELLGNFMKEPTLENLKKVNDKIFIKLESEVLNDDDMKKIIIKINDVELEKYFNSDKYKKKSMTIHSSKGLQFENVFLSEEDFYFYGNLNKENFYVACTRAKKRLFIYLNN